MASHNHTHHHYHHSGGGGGGDDGCMNTAFEVLIVILIIGYILKGCH